MIVAAGFLPHPPLLLTEYASLGDPAAELRRHCLAVIAGVHAERVERWIVLTGADREPEPISTRKPLGERVARELLEAAGCEVEPTVLTVPFDADAEEAGGVGLRLVDLAADARTGVLVMGDGSARRGEKAPGHLDERAFAMDQVVTDALAAGDPTPLGTLDPCLAAELLIAGRAAWQVLAGAVGPAEVVCTHAQDPFGVLYHWTVWRWTQ